MAPNARVVAVVALLIAVAYGERAHGQSNVERASPPGLGRPVVVVAS